MKWEVLAKLQGKNIIDTLLKNRGIKTLKEKKEFFNPTRPEKLSLKELEINQTEIKKAIKRIKEAKRKKEKVIVYGDYDADGICATAILWECLYKLGLHVLPYIPERFSEGYGLNIESIKKLKEKDPDLSLILTVDHGIVADKKVDVAKELGIDVIITDHHERGKTTPKAYAVVHTTKISGSGVAWILSRELGSSSGLELAALGTISDQLPLIGPNRSIAKYGLERLRETKRIGLLSMFEEAAIEKEKIGTYEVGFIIAPRINAMGRLTHAIDSLRLLCTKDRKRAGELADLIGRTNLERQKIVETVVAHAKEKLGEEIKESIIILSHESYHEGVIGLAAAKLVEKFYKPAIVLSKKKDISKASARSIAGFNIIEAIRKLEGLYLEGGGHPMAAGFSIETSKIEEFAKKINEIAKPFLTQEILSRKLKIDLEIDFNQINQELVEQINQFEPTGLGNFAPSFITKKVEVLETRTVGRENTHLKLKLKKDSKVIDAIAFGLAKTHPMLPSTFVDIVYSIEENIWNNHTSLQLKIKDLKVV
ncbi:MAG: single-stranded-DNA-specific exonuclease RecJ [Candidatus Woesebacteria bacterium]|nr:single-stranded-DNA-specific exonuclease RecJ [Candidatus Woesebacteria bacterium]